jgi:hypothetical protein
VNITDGPKRGILRERKQWLKTEKPEEHKPLNVNQLPWVTIIEMRYREVLHYRDETWNLSWYQE